MITRHEVLCDAVEKCMAELYKYSQPYIKYEDFKKECKEWVKKNTKDGKLIKDAEPRPYEFYYLSRENFKTICDSFVDAYKIDSQQELLNTIKILKSYCKEPIVDKYIDAYDDELGYHPGHRSYDHPNNLGKEIRIILEQIDPAFVDVAEEIENKFYEFLDMAGEFYNWNGELNSFNMTVYLGAGPNSNKEAVIDNWKKYRNKDIEIKDFEVYDDEEL